MAEADLYECDVGDDADDDLAMVVDVPEGMDADDDAIIEHAVRACHPDVSEERASSSSASSSSHDDMLAQQQIKMIFNLKAHPQKDSLFLQSHAGCQYLADCLTNELRTWRNWAAASSGSFISLTMVMLTWLLAPRLCGLSLA